MPKSTSRTRGPITATLRRSSKSRRLRKRPEMTLTGATRVISGTSPMTENAPAFVPRVTLLPPRNPPSWLRGQTTAASPIWALIATVSPASNCIDRPVGMPRQGFDVRWDQMKTLLVASSENPWLTPFQRPFPEASMTISMKMPQKTPNAVRNVRTLFPRNAS